MSKQIKYGKEAKLALKQGISKLTLAVKTTLSPLGNNVAIDRKWGPPAVVHDGVTVAKEIDLPDPFENMGAQMVKEAASRTNDSAGDGTTTATVLADYLVDKGFALIEAGANPMRLRKGMNQAVALAVGELKRISKPITGDLEAEQVATVSAQDEEIGKLISQAFKKVGKDGVVTTDEGRGTEMEVLYKEGMEFDKGYASAYFVTDQEKMESEIEDATILITDKRITNLNDIIPFLESFVKTSKNLVIIAEDIDGEALAALVVNKMRGTFNPLAIKAPAFGDRRREVLEDIAILTGGTVISEATGRSLESVTVDDCGHADKVWADKDTTRIIGGKGDRELIEARIAQIKKMVEATTADFDKEKRQERLAKLTGGVAIISVGATTEMAMKEKKERVIDAVAATKAALEEGIVAGGGSTYLNLKLSSDLQDDELKGFNLVCEALKEPFRLLLENAGITSSPESKLGFGVDVMDGQFKDMVKAGIIDPTKVARCALENAVSVAGMVLTTETLITDIEEKKS